jgi:hypothetical protein
MVRRFKANLESVESMSGKQQRLQELLRKLGELGFRSVEPLRKSFVMNALSKLTGVPVRTLEQAMPQARAELKLNETAATQTIAPQLVQEPPSSPRHKARRMAEKNLLAAIMADPHAAQVRVQVGTEGLLPISEAFSPEHFERTDLRELWSLLLMRFESGSSFHVQDIQAECQEPSLKALCGELFHIGSQRNEHMDASEAVRNAAADFDKFLHDVDMKHDAKHVMNSEDALARLEQVRRGGHNPTAIAKNMRNLNRTETVAKASADLS